MGVFGALKSAVKKPVQAANKLVNKAPGMNKLGAAVGKAPGMTALGQAAGLGPSPQMTPKPTMPGMVGQMTPANAMNPGPPQPMPDIPSGPMIQPDQPGPMIAQNAPPMMGGGQAFGDGGGGMMPPPGVQATGIGPSPQMMRRPMGRRQMMQ